jgi:lambda repressor-like predicted transcriptional regulator
MMIGNIGVAVREGVELEPAQCSLDDVIDYLRSKTHGRKAAEFAREAGVSTGYVYDVLKRRYPPGPKMLKALGVRKVVFYTAGVEVADVGMIHTVGVDQADPTANGDMGCA